MEYTPVPRGGQSLFSKASTCTPGTPACKNMVYCSIREHRLLSLSKHVATTGHRARQGEQSRPSRLTKHKPQTFDELVIAGADTLPLLHTLLEACAVHAGRLGTYMGSS